MEALGRLINWVDTAAGAWINVKDCDAVTFFANNASAETYTITEAKDGVGTGSQSPTVGLVVAYYTTKADGTTAWTKRTQAAGNVVTNVGSVAHAITAFAIDINALDPGFGYVKVTVNNSGTVKAVLHDLDVQRPPAKLVAPGV